MKIINICCGFTIISEMALVTVTFSDHNIWMSHFWMKNNISPVKKRRRKKVFGTNVIKAIQCKTNWVSYLDPQIFNLLQPCFNCCMFIDNAKLLKVQNCRQVNNVILCIVQTSVLKNLPWMLAAVAVIH